MRKLMDAKRIRALIVLPLLVGAAPLAASAQETPTQPAAESAMPASPQETPANSAAESATPGPAESPAVSARAEEAKSDAMPAPAPTAETEAPANAAAPKPETAAAERAEETMVPTAVAAQDLIGKPVMAADGKSVGKVTAVKAGQSGELIAVHIETGGFFGLWTTLREVPAGEFTPTTEGIQLRLASNEIETLSKVEVPKG